MSKHIEKIDLQLFHPFVEKLNSLAENYGEEFLRLNGLHQDNLNFTSYIDEFLKTDVVADSSIDANANSHAHDVCTMLSDMVKPHTKLLSLNKIYYEMTKKYGSHEADKWLEMEFSGGFYLHDAATASLKSYCMAYDLQELAEKGLYFIKDFCGGKPNHLETFINHVIEFVSWASNRTSGAVGLPNVLVYMYYFWKKDMEQNYLGIASSGFSEKYKENAIEHFIYSINKHFVRNSSECSFTNVSLFDKNYLVEIFGGKQFPDGSYMIDHIDGMIQFQKDFMLQVSRIREKLFFTFPVLTFCLLYKDGKFVDEEFARWANKHNMKWCDSNFFVSSDITSLSNCCRLISNMDNISGFQNSIGGSALKIGSVKVNTINLNRIALKCNGDDACFFEMLKERTNICIEVLDVIRHIIERNTEKGLLPNFSHKLIEMKNCYSTIGINGMYEAVKTMGGIAEDALGNHYYTDEGLIFGKRILDTINNIKDNSPIVKGYNINVEAVPAEQAAVKLARKDKLLYRDRVTTELYGNQWIPLDVQASISERIKMSSIYDKLVSGGQILHINIEGDFANEEQAWNMLESIAERGVIYFAYNKRISVCENGHCFFGDTCPVCGSKKVDSIQRIVGFLTRRNDYSKQRKVEFDHRHWFTIDDNTH